MQYVLTLSACHTPHVSTLFSYHTHPLELELSAHSYVMEQFSPNIYPLINKNTIFSKYHGHILVMVSISHYISILSSPAVYVYDLFTQRSNFRL